MSIDKHPRIIVIGVGNRTLSDEGAGFRVISAVAREAPAWVEVVDAGLPGPGLVFLLEGKDKAIIVDAVDAGRPAGTVCRFCPEELSSVDTSQDYSLHQGNILLYIQLAEALGLNAKKVILVGIQPQTLSLGEELSPAVEKAIPAAAELVLKELRQT